VIGRRRIAALKAKGWKHRDVESVIVLAGPVWLDTENDESNERERRDLLPAGPTAATRSGPWRDVA